MPRPLRGFVLAVACVWTILLIAAIFYSQDQNIPSRVSFAVVPAFLLEAMFYLAAGMETTRRTLERFRPFTLASLLTVTAPLPYLLYTLPLGLFRVDSLLWIAVIALGVAFWYAAMPRGNLGVDLIFLVALAALVLSRIFDRLYPDPWTRVDMKVLGTAMLVHISIAAVLSLRRMEGIGFGFLPKGRDWAWGVACYLLLLPFAFGLGVWLHFIGAGLKPITTRLVIAGALTFLGMLWVVALSEEFFFRGLMQQIFTKLFKNQWAGLILAAIAFGCVHLPFRAFPNWRFALIATLAGLFYGFAYIRTRSIRAAMVTHALTATTWRVFFS